MKLWNLPFFLPSLLGLQCDVVVLTSTNSTLQFESCRIPSFTMAEESTAETVIKSIFLTVFISLAIIGNTIVCVSIYKFKRLQTMTNYYVFNLAIADFLYGLTGMPLLLITTIAGKWMLGSALCQLSGTLQTLFVLVSIWTLCLISVNRYFAVGQHASYKSVYKKKRVLLSIACVWFIAAVVSSAPQFGWSSIIQGDNFCTIDGKDHISYSIFVVIFGYIAPLVVLIFLYTKIFLLLREHEKKMLDVRGGARKEAYSDNDRDSVEMSSTYKIESNRKDNILHDVHLNDIDVVEAVRPSEHKESSSDKFSTIERDGGEVNSNVNMTNDLKIPDQQEGSRNSEVFYQDEGANGCLDVSAHNEESDISRTASGSGTHLMANKKQIMNVTYRLETKEEQLSFRKPRTLSGIANALKMRRSTNSKKIKKFRTEARITRMLFVVVAVFFMCWTPLVIGTVLYAFNAEPKNFNLFSLGFVVASMNSICNPIIYAFMNQAFRKAFKDLFTGCKLGTDEPQTESQVQRTTGKITK